MSLTTDARREDLDLIFPFSSQLRGRGRGTDGNREKGRERD
jgi:hypothetical protein